MIHHTFYRGKKVLVMLRNNEKLVGKYEGSWSRGIILEGGIRIPYIKMRSATIVRGKTNGDN